MRYKSDHVLTSHHVNSLNQEEQLIVSKKYAKIRLKPESAYLSDLHFIQFVCIFLSNKNKDVVEHLTSDLLLIVWQLQVQII